MKACNKSKCPSDFSVEIQCGLIGVGLITLEERSGVMTLDKGKSE